MINHGNFMWTLGGDWTVPEWSHLSCYCAHSSLWLSFSSSSCIIFCDSRNSPSFLGYYSFPFYSEYSTLENFTPALYETLFSISWILSLQLLKPEACKAAFIFTSFYQLIRIHWLSLQWAYSPVSWELSILGDNVGAMSGPKVCKLGVHSLECNV